jgi:N4-bis(aminopropyl)spermidine synthase
VSTPEASSARGATAVLTEIAEAVRLQESAAGVRSIIRAFHQLAPASTKDVSRQTALPVPIVAAVGNEMRRRGLLGRERPSVLTEAGRELAAELGMALGIEADCSMCSGLEIAIPAELTEAVDRLAEIMEHGPGADLALDQSHCTPETKVRRVLALIRSGVLPGGPLLLIGDDDLVSLAVGVVGDVLGIPLTPRLAVADIAEDVLGYIADTATSLDLRVDLAQHDLREPLPERLRGEFDAAMTDPPYTPEGARLFLSRAVEGLQPGPAHSIFFSFGAKGPDEMLDVQRQVIDLGLVTHGLIRNFNEYLGSGILGGTGFFQHLLTTSDTASLVEVDYQGPLYTRDKRSRQREYHCLACGARIPVGSGAAWTSVAQLRDAGCPTCGKGPFRPGRLVQLDNHDDQPDDIGR